MISKLSTKYPMISLEECKSWVIFKHPHHAEIDEIFLRRAGALAKYKNSPIHVVSGYRSSKEQEIAYIASGGKCVNGVWQGGNGFAAKPGTSWHEFRLAIDVSDTWLKNLEKLEATKKQITLIKFGLAKPLTKENGKSIEEDWHIQPMETMGQVNKRMWAPVIIPELIRNLGLQDTGADVKTAQQQLNRFGYNLICDGTYGALTSAAVRDFQRCHALTCDGVIGPITWQKLFE